MNLLERIEQVQYGRNEIFTGVKEKQGLRDKLNDEMEAFLKRGGTVKQIPTGYSSYRDGKVPMRGVTRKKGEPIVHDASIQETPNEVIEARNKQIRGGKIGTVNRSPRKSANCLKKIEYQSKYLKEISKKFGPNDKNRLCKMVGISTKTFDNVKCADGAIGDSSWKVLLMYMENFEFTPRIKKPRYVRSTDPEVLRRQRVKESRFKAISQGLKKFNAECAYHGEVVYIMDAGNRARCSKCRADACRKQRERYRAKNESKANA